MLVLSYIAYRNFRYEWPYYNDTLTKFYCCLTGVFLWGNINLLIIKFIETSAACVSQGSICIPAFQCMPNPRYEVLRLLYICSKIVLQKKTFFLFILQDVMQNEEVSRLVLQATGRSFLSAAKELCAEAMIQGSTDNVTALVIDLR